MASHYLSMTLFLLRAFGTKKTMFYVYILQSISFPDQTYVGYTNNLSKRLNVHNSGNSSHTAKYTPWKIITYVAFTDQYLAIELEKYLKTSSGKILLNRRLINKNPLKRSTCYS